MGNCLRGKKSCDVNDVQSVIFRRQVILKNEILIWTEKRCRAWLLERSWLFIEPPDLTKKDSIRMHIESEDKFETLIYQEMDDGITIVFGVRVVGKPKRRKLMVSQAYSKKNIHTLYDISPKS